MPLLKIFLKYACVCLIVFVIRCSKINLVEKYFSYLFIIFVNNVVNKNSIKATQLYMVYMVIFS